jgi:DNA polymerase-3 subunit delta'
MSFDNIIGQKKAKEHLETILKRNRIPTGFIFCGPQGIGKKLTALEFAKTLNCTGKKINSGTGSCDKCVNCTGADKNIHPDITIADFKFQSQLLERPVDKQQHIRIETIRELTAKAQQKPSSGIWKVFIIDYADTMLTGAANALLKLLEEPPPMTLWIIITAKKSAMLATILSRCQSISFTPLSRQNTEEILMQNNFSSGHAQTLAEFSQGSVEKAYRIKEVFEKFCAVDSSDINFPFKISDMLAKELVSARGQVRVLNELLLTAAFKKWKEQKTDEKKQKLHDFMKKLYEFETYLGRNVSPQRIIQISFLKATQLGVNPFASLNNLV